MDEQLHIIIAGDRGKVHKFPFSRKKLHRIAIISGTTLAILVVTTIFSITAMTRGHFSTSEVTKLRKELKKNKAIIAEQKKYNEEQQKELDLKIAQLEMNNSEQAEAFKTEREELITNAVDELTERTELIEEIVGSLGVKFPKTSEDKKNSGGPFIKYKDEAQDELLYRADKYLKTIRRLPLGRPVPGLVTSRYGKRVDPMNNKTAFHSGVDFRGRLGQEIRATADGKVIKAFRNGGHGNYVKLDHGNGYTTSFSHMKKFFVKRGETVTRGQLIGLVGNTGRSTGPHLHYEITRDGRTVNPVRFMSIAKLKKKK